MSNQFLLPVYTHHPLSQPPGKSVKEIEKSEAVDKSTKESSLMRIRNIYNEKIKGKRKRPQWALADL